MKTLVVIPGFGNPHYDHKLEILRHNLDVLAPLDATVRLFSYKDATPELEELCNIYNNLEVTYEKGIIGEFLIRHITPAFVDRGGFERVIIILDDVELDASSFDLMYIETLRHRYDLDIISPRISMPDKTYWQHMVHCNNASSSDVSRVSMLELFCYYMTADAYKKYYSYLDGDNPWIWGMDFMVYFEMGLKCALASTMLMHHHYYGTGAVKKEPDPRECGTRYLRKHGLDWKMVFSRPLYIT